MIVVIFSIIVEVDVFNAVAIVEHEETDAKVQEEEPLRNNIEKTINYLNYKKDMDIDVKKVEDNLKIIDENLFLTKADIKSGQESIDIIYKDIKKDINNYKEKKEEARQEEKRQEEKRQEEKRQEEKRQEEKRQEEARQEEARQEAKRQEEAKNLAIKRSNGYWDQNLDGRIDSYKKEELIISSGISSDDFEYVDYIINRESGWNYTAQGYGVYGLPQASMAHGLSEEYFSNPVEQMRWADNYAISRYGSWESAYNQWQTFNSW